MFSGNDIEQGVVVESNNNLFLWNTLDIDKSLSLTFSPYVVLLKFLLQRKRPHFLWPDIFLYQGLSKALRERTRDDIVKIFREKRTSHRRRRHSPTPLRRTSVSVSTGSDCTSGEQ
jgi:hypothetical protein